MSGNRGANQGGAEEGLAFAQEPAEPPFRREWLQGGSTPPGHSDGDAASLDGTEPSRSQPLPPPAPRGGCIIYYIKIGRAHV